MKTQLHNPVNPTEDQIITGIAEYFDCPPAVALSWLTQLFTHFNPKAAAERLVLKESHANE